MNPRYEYIQKRVRLFKKWSPKIFHNKITQEIHEIYDQLVNSIDNKDIYKSIQSSTNNVEGGNIEKTQQIQFNDFIFNISVKKEKDDIFVGILTHNKDSPLYCGNMMISRKNKLAIITNISYYKDCAVPVQSGLNENDNKIGTKTASGSIILKFILKYLKKNKETLNIDRIVLTDNSFKICMNCPSKNKSKNIQLSNLNVLLYGDTWYGKYGFRPYDKNKNIPDEKEINYYNKNKKIMKKVLVKDTKLIDHIRKGIYIHKLYNIDMTMVINKIKEWQDRKLSEVLKIIMKDYEKYCCLFEYIGDKLFDELGLKSFRNYSFYLDIIYHYFVKHRHYVA